MSRNWLQLIGGIQALEHYTDRILNIRDDTLGHIFISGSFGERRLDHSLNKKGKDEQFVTRSH